MLPAARRLTQANPQVSHLCPIWKPNRHAFGYFAAAVLGIACFFLLGAAVTTVVPKSESALPVVFGTMLPLAFISDVFFSVSQPPAWLHDLASALPAAPIVQAMEDCFDPATQS